MRLRDSGTAFGIVSIVNHWLLAALMIGLLCSGLLIAEVLEGPVRGAVIHPHKAVGALVLAVVAWMVLWRAVQPARPEAVPGTSPLLARARRAMHLLLVLGAVLMAVSGVVMSLFGGHALDIFGLVTIAPAGEVDALAGPAHAVHEVAGWALAVAVLGHVAVALKHHLIDHDATFRRMIGRGGTA